MSAGVSKCMSGQSHMLVSHKCSDLVSNSGNCHCLIIALWKLSWLSVCVCLEELRWVTGPIFCSEHGLHALLLDSTLLKNKGYVYKPKSFVDWCQRRVYLSSSKSFLSSSSLENQLCSGALMDHEPKHLSWICMMWLQYLPKNTLKNNGYLLASMVPWRTFMDQF